MRKIQNHPKNTLRHMWRKNKLILKSAVLAVLLTSSMQSQAFCFDEAAQRHSVNSNVLRAIAKHESRMKADMVVQNTNGTEDLGLTGINSVHLPLLARFGIDKTSLLDACVNLNVGAWLLRKKIIKYGNTWQAVGAYHSETSDKNQIYQRKIYAELGALQ